MTTYSGIRNFGYLSFLKTANFNSTSDQAMTIVNGGSNTTFSTFIAHKPTGASFNTVAGGLYTGPSKTGTTLLASSTTWSGLNPGTTDIVIKGAGAGGTISFTGGTIYLSLTTAQGAAATVNIMAIGHVAPTGNNRTFFGAANSSSASQNDAGALVGMQVAALKTANFNSTSDQAMLVVIGTRGFRVQRIITSSPSGASFNTAAGGAYTGASKSGTTIVGSSQAYSSLNPGTVDVAYGSTSLTATRISSGTIYLSLTTGQGAAATADVTITGNLEY